MMGSSVSDFASPNSPVARIPFPDVVTPMTDDTTQDFIAPFGMIRLWDWGNAMGERFVILHWLLPSGATRESVSSVIDPGEKSVTLSFCLPEVWLYPQMCNLVYRDTNNRPLFTGDCAKNSALADCVKTMYGSEALRKRFAQEEFVVNLPGKVERMGCTSHFVDYKDGVKILQMEMRRADDGGKSSQEKHIAYEDEFDLEL